MEKAILNPKHCALRQSQWEFSYLWSFAVEKWDLEIRKIFAQVLDISLVYTHKKIELNIMLGFWFILICIFLYSSGLLLAYSYLAGVRKKGEMNLLSLM